MNLDELSDTAEYALPPPGAAAQIPRPSTSVQVDLAGRSHQGKVRPNNEALPQNLWKGERAMNRP
jgi:hypothetical protein